MKFKILSILFLFFSISCNGQEKFPSAGLVNQMMTIPNVIDTNQDEELSIEEVMKTPDQLMTLDLNNDGELDWKEMCAYEEDLTFIRYHNIVNLIDSNGDVRISSDEIKNAPQALQQLDLNGDWHISKKEIGLGKLPQSPTFS